MNVIQMVTMIENKELKSVGLSFFVWANVWGIPLTRLFIAVKSIEMKLDSIHQEKRRLVTEEIT